MLNVCLIIRAARLPIRGRCIVHHKFRHSRQPRSLRSRRSKPNLSSSVLPESVRIHGRETGVSVEPVTRKVLFLHLGLRVGHVAVRHRGRHAVLRGLSFVSVDIHVFVVLLDTVGPGRIQSSLSIGQSIGWIRRGGSSSGFLGLFFLLVGLVGHGARDDVGQELEIVVTGYCVGYVFVLDVSAGFLLLSFGDVVGVLHEILEELLGCDGDGESCVVRACRDVRVGLDDLLDSGDCDIC